MLLRPMSAGDVAAAAQVAALALPPTGADAVGWRRWMHGRIERIVATDPPGCWVAEDAGGAVAGVALALVRDGIWGLSLLAVVPDRQARGIGRALLDAALRHDAGSRGWLIASSVDPRALRLYARAGFALHPCVAAAGAFDHKRLPGGLRSRVAGPDRLAAAADLAREVRGGAYDPDDLRLLLDLAGGRLLVCGDDGFAIARAGSTAMVVARDDDAAADLLWSVLATAPPGGTVLVDFIGAGQDWAVRTALDAGLALSPDGPYFSRGAVGPLRPFLPSGAFL